MSICFICLVSLKQPIHLAPNPSSHLLPPQHIQCNQLSLPPPPSARFSLLQHLHHDKRRGNKQSNDQPYRHQTFIDCRDTTPNPSKCLPNGTTPASEICSRRFTLYCPPASRCPKMTRMLLFRECSSEAIRTSGGTQFGKAYIFEISDPAQWHRVCLPLLTSTTRSRFYHFCYLLDYPQNLTLRPRRITTCITTHQANMGITWNSEAQADLFQAVLAFSPPLTQIPAADREGIVAFMHSRGHAGATWEGIR